MRNLKEKVLNILKEYPETRNNDRLLTAVIWKTYYKSRIYTAKNQLDYISLKDFMDLPSLDNISRVRRKIQEQKQYLPTSKEVRVRRKISEMAWREWAINN